jgi:uncharacterized OsmC-like protein/alpha-beta hydrolase superfamily lysophospholipase
LPEQARRDDIGHGRQSTVGDSVAKLEKLSFQSSDGLELAGRVDRPAGPLRAWALFAHCFTCSKDIAAASRISRALTEHGVGVFRFDFTGLGSSEGEFANINFSSNVRDLFAATDAMREHLGAPTLLIGHSLGGAAVLAAAGEIPEVRAVCTIGAPSDPGHLRHLFVNEEEDIRAAGQAEVSIGGRRFTIQSQFLDDIAEQPQAARIASLKRALLVFHAPHDQVVGIDNARAIFVAAKHPKSFVSLDDADHLLSKKRDAEYVATVLAGWATRYLPEVDHEVTAHGVVRVTSSPNGKFLQEVRAGKHLILADEPTSSGGDDAGLTPYDLLLAGLGACTSMTLRMYADRKGLPLEGVKVELRHHRIHSDDCDDCESSGGQVDVIDREITIHGDLDEKVRTRLLQIADKCPVHRTLHNEIKVRTVEVRGE